MEEKFFRIAMYVEYDTNKATCFFSWDTGVDMQAVMENLRQLIYKHFPISEGFHRHHWWAEEIPEEVALTIQSLKEKIGTICFDDRKP